MAELTLDDVDRHAFASKLGRMRVTKLVRREPPPDPGVSGKLAQLGSRGGRGHRRPRVGPSMTQNNGPGGSDTRWVSQAASCSNPN